MIINKYYNILTPEQVEYFGHFAHTRLYSSQTQLVYSGQIPTAAYLLVEGTIILKDAQKRTVRKCEKNSLIGFSELYNKIPYKYTVEIENGSKVIILDKSTMQEISKHYNKNPVHYFKEFELLTKSAS